MVINRNRRTLALARQDCHPITARILAGLGEKGDTIRLRLARFYQERASAPRPEDAACSENDS